MFCVNVCNPVGKPELCISARYPQNFWWFSWGYQADFLGISGRFLVYTRHFLIIRFCALNPLLGTKTWQVTRARYFIRGKLFLIIIQPIQFLSLMNVLVGIRSGFPLPPNPELLPSLFLHSQVTLKSGECFGRVLVSALLSILPLHLPFPRLTPPP